MAKIYNISITADTVITSMEQHSAYVGKKSKDDGSDYDRIATSAEDKAELQSLWNDAATIVYEECRPFSVSNTSVPGQSINLQLVVPERIAATEDDVEESVVAYMTFALLKRWFMITNREDAERYEAEAGQRRERIHSALYDRQPAASAMSDKSKKWINF